MTLAAALTQLATWNVSGVTTHYAYNALPPVIPEVNLPALVPNPGQMQSGAEALNINFDAGLATFTIEHYLLVHGIGLDIPSERFSDSVTLVDNYLAAVANDFDLNGTLAVPLRLGMIEIGAFEWGGILYRGILFPHIWQIEF